MSGQRTNLPRISVFAYVVALSILALFFNIAMCDGFNGPRIAVAQSNISEKEAFESAKELGTIEAWEAFLKRFSTGFRADLARAYLRRLGSTESPREQGSSERQARSSVKTREAANLDDFTSRRGHSTWRMTTYDIDDGSRSKKAAAVTANGVELLLYCNRNKRLASILRESRRGKYPNFDIRIRQGLKAAKGLYGDNNTAHIPMRFSNGAMYSVSAEIEELTGDVRLGSHAKGGGFRPTGDLIEDMMSEETVNISAPPFGSDIQLTNSRTAICSVSRSCGVRPSGCPGSNSRTTSSQNSKKKYRSKKKRSQRAREAAACRDIGMVYLGGRCQPKSRKARQRAKQKKNVPCPAGMYRNPYGVCQPNETGG